MSWEMPSVCVRELRPRLRAFRLFLLILFLPICLSMLFCSMYSTYLTVETWNCSSDQLNRRNESEHGSNRDSSAGPNVKCYTILDAISGQLSRYITERKILLIVRTFSLINTLSTYMSAWIAAYRLSFLPLAWLSLVSMASFFVTLNFTILFGPMTGQLSHSILRCRSRHRLLA